MKLRTLIISAVLVFFIFATIQSCKKDEAGTNDNPPADGGPVLPSTPYNYAGVLDNMPAYYKSILIANPHFDNTPPDNPITNDGATLGRVLFYDKALSVNNITSCASCHHQDKAFTDGLAFSKGFNGATTRRSSMALANIRFFELKKMFWDGRAATLEEQVLKPITDHIEMGMPSLTELITKLNTKSYYPQLFQKAFGSTAITPDRISKALAQFVRSIVSFNSRFDQGQANNFANFTATELRGLQRVKTIACGECHNDIATQDPSRNPTFLFSNTNFVTNGLDLVYTDNGVGDVTTNISDDGKFKITSLRNIEITGPYMHDGRFTNLGQVLTHYQQEVKNHPNLPIQMTAGGFGFPDSDKADMIAFLKTLTDHTLTTDVKYSDPFR